MKKQMNNNKTNFNKKFDEDINKYINDGGELILTIKKHRFEMLMIAAKEGLNSFKKQAKERKSEDYVFEAIEDIKEMAEVLQKLAEISIVTVTMNSNEND